MKINNREIEKNKNFLKDAFKVMLVPTAVCFLIAGGVKALKNLDKVYPSRPYVVFEAISSGTLKYREKIGLEYCDDIPFGSLDYVIDNTSGKRIVRKPTEEDINNSKRLEGILQQMNQKARTELDKEGIIPYSEIMK